MKRSDYHKVIGCLVANGHKNLADKMSVESANMKGQEIAMLKKAKKEAREILDMANDIHNSDTKSFFKFCNTLDKCYKQLELMSY